MRARGVRFHTKPRTLAQHHPFYKHGPRKVLETVRHVPDPEPGNPWAYRGWGVCPMVGKDKRGAALPGGISQVDKYLS